MVKNTLISSLDAAQLIVHYFRKNEYACGVQCIFDGPVGVGGHYAYFQPFCM
jgi:hypothetical protein